MTTDAEQILVADPEVAGVPVVECGEALVSVLEICPDLVLDVSDEHQAHLGYQPDYRLRSGVAVRLHEARRLLEPGYDLLVKECFRSLEIQRQFFDEYLGDLRARYPMKTNSELHREASKYVAPPDVSAHPTGSAVDLTLIDQAGREVDMGTHYDADPVDSASACYTDALDISDTARHHRSLLTSAMTAAGFVNYPTEWWHWSFGDRYWAYVTFAPHATYGPV